MNHPTTVDRDHRDEVLERLLRCTLSLCRAQRDPEGGHALVEGVIADLDQVIRELRDLEG